MQCGFLIAVLVLPSCAAFVVQPGAFQARGVAKEVTMTRAKGPFPLPNPPADFAGAQWAPHVFPPFPINVERAAAEVKEILKEEDKQAAAAPAAPAAAPPAAPVADKATYTVVFKTPDGDLTYEHDPSSDNFLLDACDELDNADDFAELPYACRAGACSACAGKVISGEVDSSACGFLTDEQKADGWVLTCTAKPKSDCVIETHKEEDLF